jgi:hypothetical protein
MCFLLFFCIYHAVVGRNPEILPVYGITGLRNDKNKIKRECEIKNSGTF